MQIPICPKPLKIAFITRRQQRTILWETSNTYKNTQHIFLITWVNKFLHHPQPSLPTGVKTQNSSQGKKFFCKNVSDSSYQKVFCIEKGNAKVFRTPSNQVGSCSLMAAGAVASVSQSALYSVFLILISQLQFR